MNTKVLLEKTRQRREWCVEDLARHDEDIARFEAELAEAEKPKLRHADFGWDKDGAPCGAVRVSGKSVLRMVGNMGVGDGVCEDDGFYGPTIVVFNAMDDLKAMAEPLTEFENCGLSFTSQGGLVWAAKSNGEKFYFDYSAVLDLRRLVHTAKQEQHGKEKA